MRKVSIIGANEIRWGVLKEKSLMEMIGESAIGAIKNAGIEKEAIDAVFLGNAFGQLISNQGTLGSAATNALGIPHVPGIRYECACSSGAVALREAYIMVSKGVYDFALVIGAEKMNMTDTPEILKSIASGLDLDEQRAGVVAPAAFALYASAHMAMYGTKKSS